VPPRPERVRSGTPRSASPVALDMTDTSAIRPPAGLLAVTARLEAAGHDAWCVGGAVRDALMGHPGHDWDLASPATPDQVQRLFRSIPTGIEHGTISVFDPTGELHEVTTFRNDISHDGRNATVEFSKTIQEDLARRDFTINAIAFRPKTGELCDPFDGLGDMERRVIRAVGDPSTRMIEDRLRALRAIRFAGRFGFEIEPATWAAIQESAPHLRRLSQERVKMELDKSFEQLARPGDAMALWRDAGAITTLLPALAPVVSDQIALDTINRVPPTPKDTEASARFDRMTALCLSLPADEAGSLLRSLKASGAETSHVMQVVERWARLSPAMGETLRAEVEPDERTLRRWAASIGRKNQGTFLRVAAARWEAERAAGLSAPTEARVFTFAESLDLTSQSSALELKELAVTGSDLVAAGVKAGPALGRTLERLLAEVIDEPGLNSRDLLLARAPDVAATVSNEPANPRRSGR
jgi:tRNA nucleotidyltransferase (CCA-adding enzyme)